MKTNPLLTSALALLAASTMTFAQDEKPTAEAGAVIGPASEPQAPPAAPKTSPASSGPDLHTIASQADDFSTFAAAVEAAGLKETLKGDGPFTLFAPPNAAFKALPNGTLAELMKPENKEKLAAILSFHVIPGKLMSADLVSQEVSTVQGGKVVFKLDGTTVTVSGAKITRPDIIASNGVIHVIDKVLMPSDDN